MAAVTTQIEKLINLYQQMSDLTQPECANNCRIPYSCCSPEYCQEAKRWAKEEYGITLDEPNFPNKKNLLYMGPNGCTVAPYLRTMCTLHTCAINGPGFKPGDEKWTKQYFKLRSEINELEMKRAGYK